MQLDNMILQRQFYFSVCCRRSNLKNPRSNSFKIGAHFKEQLLKKNVLKIFLNKYFCMFCFIKVFVFSVRTSKDTKTYLNTSKSKSVIKNCRHVFFVTLHHNMLKLKISGNYYRLMEVKLKLVKKISKYRAYFTQLHNMSKLRCRD